MSYVIWYIEYSYAKREWFERMPKTMKITILVVNSIYKGFEYKFFQRKLWSQIQKFLSRLSIHEALHADKAELNFSKVITSHPNCVQNPSIVIGFPALMSQWIILLLLWKYNNYSVIVNDYREIPTLLYNYE